MPHVEAWVRSLVALLLLAGIAEVLLPSGTMKGYTRSVLGLLVLVGVLQPLAGVLRGGWHLDLPAVWSELTAAAGTGGAGGRGGQAAVSAEASSAEAAAAAAYEQLVASQAARVAEQVPGVQTATAALRFGPAAAGGVPPVVAATVEVTPTLSGLGQGAALEAAVGQAVAQSLSLPPSAVSVREL